MNDVLLWAILLLLLALVALTYRRGRLHLSDVESALAKVWRESGLDTRIGELTTHVKDIRDAHRSIERMLRVPVERAAIGEVGLEAILADQVPPDMYGIRQRCLDGKVPDAFIRSTVGIICIDSKFPLDNYARMVTVEDARERDGLRKQFLRDVIGRPRRSTTFWSAIMRRTSSCESTPSEECRWCRP